MFVICLYCHRHIHIHRNIHRFSAYRWMTPKTQNRNINSKWDVIAEKKHSNWIDVSFLFFRFNFVGFLNTHFGFHCFMRLQILSNRIQEIQVSIYPTWPSSWVDWSILINFCLFLKKKKHICQLPIESGMHSAYKEFMKYSSVWKWNIIEKKRNKQNQMNKMKIMILQAPQAYELFKPNAMASISIRIAIYLEIVQELDTKRKRYVLFCVSRCFL